jgi:hypothetical protein
MCHWVYYTGTCAFTPEFLPKKKSEFFEHGTWKFIEDSNCGGKGPDCVEDPEKRWTIKELTEHVSRLLPGGERPQVDPDDVRLKMIPAREKMRNYTQTDQNAEDYWIADDRCSRCRHCDINGYPPKAR